MNNPNLQHEGTGNSHLLKKLAGKIVSNLEGVNRATKDFNMKSQAKTRVGVSIDWSNGTIILEGNN